MRIGLAYDLKDDVPLLQGEPEDAREEYDSLETVDSIANALHRLGHTVVRLGGGREFLGAVLETPGDFVFNISEGRGTYRSREVQVPAVLEMLDLFYAGSDPESLAICLDKPLAKQLVAAAGLATPRWRVIDDLRTLEEADWTGFSLPAFVKPACEGSSKGITARSRVASYQALASEAARLLHAYRQPVLVEEFIRGDELTVAVIGDPPEVLGIMRVVPLQGDGLDFFYSLEVKREWQKLVRYECPAAIAHEAAQRVREASLRIFNLLGCRDMARIDFRLARGGDPFFLEINPLPGLRPGYSDLPIMAQMRGMAYTELISRIIDSSLQRYRQCLKLSA
jgi:D-alanine-D-alanine ligase